MIDAKLKENPAENVSFKYLWLTSDHNLSIDAFSRLSHVQLFAAEKKRECIDLLNAASPSEKIIFIVNESLSHDVIKSTSDQCAVKVVFVIRSIVNDSQFDEWIHSYVKVRTFKYFLI